MSEGQHDPESWLSSLNARALAAGGAESIEQQHQRGKLTARERLDYFYDPESFVELDRFVEHRCHDFGMAERRVPGDGVVTGYGSVDGRRVFAFAQDFTIFGGSLGAAHAQKIVKLQELALKVGAPIVGLCDSGGARIQEGVESLGGYADIFLRNALASGVVPQLSAIMGPCAGGAVYSPALTDFVFMVENTSYMFITGPDVIRAVTHEEVTKEALGGAEAHATESGVCHFTASDDQSCLDQLRRLLTFLPSNNAEDPPRRTAQDPSDRRLEGLSELIPPESDRPYDMARVVAAVVDDADFFQVQEQYARNILVGFARLAGRPIGVVANQPAHLAGVLDIAASVKAARFVRFCDCFNLPVLTFVDVPGFLPGVDQEHRGIISNGAKLLYAYCEATVPKLTVITRKAYGGAYDVMSSKHIRGDFNLAFPQAEIAVMGPSAAVNVIFRRELSSAADPEARRAELVQDYRARFASPERAASLGFVDEIVEPAELRRRLTQGLELLSTKRLENPAKKHGNPPL